MVGELSKGDDFSLGWHVFVIEVQSILMHADCLLQPPP